MNILKERGAAKAICSICHSPDYVRLPKREGQTKPEFACNSCGEIWSYGKDGGKYAQLALETWNIVFKSFS